MNTLDIIIIALLLIAAFTGWRSGLTRQILSFAGVIIGIILANSYGLTVGSAIGLEDQVALFAGFAIVLIATIIIASLLGRVLQKLFHFVGLGILDNILGVVLSVTKYVVIMAILFTLLTPLNATIEIVPQSMLDGSIAFNKIMELGSLCTPSLEWMEFEVQTNTLYQNV